jgi:2-keto-3-deoxy-L-rhamnonate aldolase RhmA
MTTRPGATEGAARIHESLTLGSRVRARYADGVVRGTFLIELPTSRAVRSLAFAGFDFVVLDLEHSTFDTERLAALIAEAQLVGLPAIVRVWGRDPGLIGKVLDAGANGVMAPRVETVAEAEAVVEAARYAPGGSRGIAPLISYKATGVPQPRLGDEIVVIAQIEGRQGVANAAAIAAVPGLDGVFVGVHDLAQSLGLPEAVESDAVAAAAAQVAESVGDAMLGVYVEDPAQSAVWAARGFRFQCISFDGRMLVEGAARTLEVARAGTDNQTGRRR